MDDMLAMDVTDEECLMASQQAEEDIDIAKNRFGEAVSERDVMKAVEAGIPPATRRKMEWSERVWSAWCTKRSLENVPEDMRPNFQEEIHKIGSVPLQWMLQRFVLEVRNEKGEHYPPDTLYGLCTSLQKVVNVRGKRSEAFFASYEFQSFKDVLDSEMKRLRKQGLGAVRRQAHALTDSEEERLWSSGVLGSSNPQQLLNTMFFMAGKHFALRSGDEHRSLRARNSQMAIGTDRETGRRFVEYNEDVSKSNQGGLRHRKTSRKSVRAFDNPAEPERCFVRLFELYLSKCPEQDRPDAFYLKAMPKPTAQQWYCRSPLGHNTLKGMFRSICTTAGLDDPTRFTNHSLRRTAATKLYQADFDEQLIAEVTGHRSTAIREYKITSNKQKARVSDALQGQTDASVDLESTATVEPKAKRMFTAQAAPVSIKDITAESGASITINLNFNSSE